MDADMLGDRKMSQFAVLAIGRDQRGIVAGITGELHKLGFNIETSHMGILGDQFSMTLVVSGNGCTDSELKEALTGVMRGRASDMGESSRLVVTDIHDFQRQRPAEASHLVTVYCQDREGVIGDIAAVLSDREINITQLYSSVQEIPDNGEFCVTRVYIAPSKTSLDEAELAEDMGERLKKAEAQSGATALPPVPVGRREPFVKIRPLEEGPPDTP
jgi:glycine cleavage system transcriptional repressor